MWNRVTEKLPPKDKDVLVFQGSRMFVSHAVFYSYGDTAYLTKEQRDRVMASVGYFFEFGQRAYFDDSNVFWAELPEPPKG